MKKLFFVAIAALFLTGCGATVRESGYYEHGTHYKDCEHMKFSICGYPNVTKKDVQESKAENWWGLEVKVPANQ
jgi:hypothetical protein